jgi:hypothetical protein
MTLQAVPCGPIFPALLAGSPLIKGDGYTWNSPGTIDAAGEKVAAMGEVIWADGGTHTMGSSSKIHFRTATITLSDAATNIRIGIQDVNGNNGTTTLGLTPDGTFDVYRDIAGNGGVITASNTAYAIQLSTSGSKSIAHGTRLAVVWDVTARGGSDSFQVAAIGSAGYMSFPSTRHYTTSWWASTGSHPVLLLEADDGVFGILAGAPWFTAITTTNFSSSSTPDEIGLVFQVPFRCKVDAVVGFWGSSSGAPNADGNWKLYSTPLGTPSQIASASVYGEQASYDTSVRPRIAYLGEVTLEPGTDYCLALESTGSSNISILHVTLESDTHRPVMGLANCRRGTRSNGSGAFSETTTEIPVTGLRISALDDARPQPTYCAGVM